MAREIALDTETTGLEPKSGHRIVEIGCVEMIDQVRTGEVYHIYINPERNMPREAEDVHGLSQKFLANKPIFKHIAKDFLDFIGDSNLVIHNAIFDMKFINNELSLINKPLISMDRTIDTLAISRLKFPGQPANLDSLCRRFSIDLSMRTKHGALLDAELLADVYLELNGGRQIMMELNNKPTDNALKIVKRSEKVNIKYRKFLPSDDELLMHQNFIQKLKNAIWG